MALRTAADPARPAVRSWPARWGRNARAALAGRWGERGALGAVVLLGAAVRVWDALGPASRTPLIGDANYYRLQAKLLAAGRGFLEPFLYYDHRAYGFARPVRLTSVAHPPAFVGLLAAGDLLGLRSVLDERLIGVALGTATVLVVARCGRRLGGPVTGVVAGLFAAVDPALWLEDPTVMSESLAGLVLAGLLLALLRYLDRPSLRRAWPVGVLAAAGVLTRGEFALDAAVVAVPLLLVEAWRGLRRKDPAALRRAGQLLAAGVLGVALVAPWSAFMLSEFPEVELVSTQLGRTVRDASCPVTFSGPLIGYWSLSCQEHGSLPLPVDWTEDRSVQDHHDVSVGLRYVAAHLGELPAVMAARVGRVLGVFRLGQQEVLDRVSYGWPAGADEAGFDMWFALLVLFGVGLAALVRSRRRRQAWVLAGISLATLCVVALSYGATRFRLPMDIAVVCGAAVGVDAVRARLVRRRGLGALREAKEIGTQAEQAQAGPQAPGEGAPQVLAAGGLARPIAATSGRSRIVSGWPAGQRAGSSTSAIARRSSNTAPQDRQRNSYSGIGVLRALSALILKPSRAVSRNAAAGRCRTPPLAARARA